MANNLPGDDPRNTLEIISPGKDFLLREKVDSSPWLKVGSVKPALGDAHPQATRFPNHKLAVIVPADEVGWTYLYYLAPLSSQQNYNWQFANELSDEYDTVGLTFIVLRSAYAPGASLGSPPSLGGRTWTRIGERQVRRDAKTDGLFVELVQTFMDISTARSGVRVDLETGALRSYSRQIVAAGTSGTVVQSDGTYKEVRPINKLWSVAETQAVSGLAGGGNNSSRTYEKIDNFYWPPVLDYIKYLRFPAAGGTYDRKIGYRPVWKEHAYSGPCTMTVVEKWTSAAPALPTLTPMLPMPIFFDGGLLNLSIESCLHQAGVLSETPGTSHPDYAYYLYAEEIEATSPTDWPATYVAEFSVTPAFGGYLSRYVLVDRPERTDRQNVLRVTAAEGSALTEAALTWTMTNVDGAVDNYWLDVATDPTFASGFLTGFNNKDMNTSTTATVTGLTGGQIYYVRVRAEINPPAGANYEATSNIATYAAPLRAQMSITVVETSAVDPTTVDYGYREVGGTEVRTYRVTNTGNVALTGLARELSGTDADQWTAASLSNASLAAAATRDVTVDFTPDEVNATATALLRFTATNALGNQIILEGEAQVDPNLVITTDADVAVPANSTWDFGSVTGTTVDGFKATNEGTAAATDITTVDITGADAAYFSENGTLAGSLSALTTDAWEITFTPSDGDRVYNAQIEIYHDAVNTASPYIIYLTGTKV